MSIKTIKYVLGIDFGAKSSGISVAHVDKPSVKYTVDTWEGDEKTSNKEPSQFLTSILYQADGEIKCGLSNNENDKAIRDEKDVYIDNIKQYLLDIEQANIELGEMKEGLTIKQVVSDYLRLFIQLGRERILLQEKFKQSEDFKAENIRYCISCPKSQEEFIKSCFIEAEIVEEEEIDERLVFVTEAEATAYHCISLDRQKTKIIHDHIYLVCDIGHCSFGISKIQADTTENLSHVELITEEPGQGSMSLEIRLRSYLTENQDRLKLNPTIIDKLVEKFVNDIKFSFSMTHVEGTIEENDAVDREEDDEEEEGEDYDEDDDEEEDDEDEEIVFIQHKIVDKQVEDLEIGNEEQEEATVPVFNEHDKDGNPILISPQELDEHVFSPYIDSVFNHILEADESVAGINGESRIFLSGRYSSNDHFLEKLMTSKDSRFAQFFCPIEDDYINAVSLGATSFGLRSDRKLQTPFYVNTEPADKNGPKKNGSLSTLEQKKDDFIVGIDFGTTYSGCSYADCRDIEKSSEARIKTIETGWPGGNAISFGKTPTLIMYDRNMKPKYWGQEAKINVDHNRDLTLLGNFKLFLSPKSVAQYYGPNNEEIERIRAENGYSARVENSNSNQDKKGPYKVKKYNKEDNIDAVKIIADYLRLFKDRVIKHIIDTETRKPKIGGFRELFRKKEANGGFNFKFVITVPAMWTASAKETMAQAAIEATIIKKDELDKLLIISEPEAAALFCEKKYANYIRDPNDPTAGSNFIVCDAGGGTVDLVTFSLTFDECGKPMICQIGDGSGDTCGSTYLDGKFKKYLEEFYQDMELDITFSNTNFDSVMDNFIHNLKINYVSKMNEDSYLDIRLPTNRIIHQIPEKARGKYYLHNNNTVLRMRNVDMKEKVFDDIVDSILKLIQGQLDQAMKAGTDIKTILMIGGFSRNKYLQQRVKDEYNGLYTVGIPEEGIAAVSHGAVSYGLEPRMISERLAGHSLALEVRAPFDKSKGDIREKIVNDINHNEYTKNRLEYFVKKSQVIDGENRETYHKTVSVEYPNNAVIAVFSYDFKEEDNPKDWRYVSKKHTKIMEETIELPKLENICDGEKIHFDVGLQMDHIGVTVTVKCKDTRINAYIRRNTGKNGLTIDRKCSLVVFRNKSPLIEYSLAQSNFLLGSS